MVKALTAKELTESFKKIVINLYGEQWNFIFKKITTNKWKRCQINTLTKFFYDYGG